MGQKLQVQRDLIYQLDKSIPEMIKTLKSKVIDYSYFKRVGFAKRIYNFFGYDLSENLIDEFLSKGVMRTHLTFEEIQEYLNEGAGKAEFIIGLFNEGRGFIDKRLGRKTTYQ